jgi:hypothetical protein
VLQFALLVIAEVTSGYFRQVTAVIGKKKLSRKNMVACYRRPIGTIDAELVLVLLAAQM